MLDKQNFQKFFKNFTTGSNGSEKNHGTKTKRLLSKSRQLTKPVGVWNNILYKILRSDFMGNKIKCSHILVQKQSEALAIMERLKTGEKFGKLAKQLSIDSGSAKRDGNLGYFGRGMMVKPFEETAFKLKVGETSEPVKSEFGYHIIKRFG